MSAAGSVGAGLAIACGVLLCFFGYRVLRVALAVAGFFIGAAAVSGAVAMIPSSGQVAVLVAAAVGGVLGAVLAALAYKVGVFILGAGAGALVAVLVLAAVGGAATPLILVIAGVAGGVLALLLQRAVVSILTAFTGAWGIVVGICHFTGWADIRTGLLAPGALPAAAPGFYIVFGGWFLLGVLGALVQLRGAKKKR